MASLEILENRIAPAGLINVTFDKGALVLAPDTSAADADHAFSVTALDPWTVELRSLDGTQFKLGDEAATETLLLTSPIKSLTATLGGGIDDISLIGLSIGGDVKIDAGAGNNILKLNTLSAKGGLQVIGGGGNDTILAEGTVSIGKDFILNLSNIPDTATPDPLESNSLTIGGDNFKVGGNLSYTGGAGLDAFSALSGVASIGKDLSLQFGAGSGNANIAALAGFSVGKNLIFDTSASVGPVGGVGGDYSSLTLLSLATRIGGDVRITDGEGSSSLTLVTTGSIGKINVVTGGGNAQATVGYLQLKTKSIDFDASASSAGTETTEPDYSSLMVIGLGTSGSAPAINYTGGVGNDNLMAIGLGGASVNAELGDGENTAIVANLGGSVKGITITGGDGVDNVVAAVIGGKVGNIDIQTGDSPGAPEPSEDPEGADNVIVAVVNGSAKNINIASGEGFKLTNVLLANATVSGKISATHESTATDLASFNIAALNSKVGSLDYTNTGGTNTFAVGFNLSGIPGGIPSIPGFPGGGSFSLVNGLTVAKGISVSTGAGDDLVNLNGAANVKVGGGITLDLGNGNNGVESAFTSFTTKSLKVTGGTGDDTVALQGTGNLGAVTLDLGAEAGVNTATINGGVVPLAIASLNFTSTSTSAATGPDSLTLARVIAAGKVSATFGAGASTVKIDDTIIGNTFNLDTGAGDDEVNIDTDPTNAATVLSKAATINLGDGNDKLKLGGNGTSAKLIAKSTFSADGGSGTNTLNNDEAGNVFKDPKFLNFAD